jgi:sulfotransferase family protein
LIRRNFSSRACQLSGGDAILISIPKSGRTWVRTFLCAYFCQRHGREFTLEPQRYVDLTIPRVIYSHDLFEHRTKGSWWDRLRGKYLVPAREWRRVKKIILLARDPRDCFVSLYLQMTRRTAETPAKLKQKTTSDMLRDGRFGIRAMVRTMNDWLNELTRHDHFALLRYETIRATPAEKFRQLLEWLGENDPALSILEGAVDFSRFENMQKMEAAWAFDSKILQPGDARDRESFKVRRGKIGGFEDYLSIDDQQYAAEAMRSLHPRFGYAPLTN